MLTVIAPPDSPDGARVRAALHSKGLRFDERAAQPPERTTATRLAAAWRSITHGAPHASRDVGESPPTLLGDDGREVVTGYAAIVEHLDTLRPLPLLVPTQSTRRGRARLLERWAEGVLLPAVEQALWRVPSNAAHLRARAAHDEGTLERALRIVTSPLGPRPTDALNRLAEALDPLEAALDETGWLDGPGPTVADVSVAGFLSLLWERDGGETLRARRRVARLVKNLSAPLVEKSRAAESDTLYEQARRDAAEHRLTLPTAPGEHT